MFAYRPMDNGPGCVKEAAPVQTSYRDMIYGVSGKRSSFPPGYSGHMPTTRFKFGYNNVGPDSEHFSLPRTSSETGVVYDLRPNQSSRHYRSQSTPNLRRKHEPREQIPDDKGPAGVPISPSSRKFCQTAYEPDYLEKKEKTSFPYYRPLGGKSGSVAPGSQYPSHPGPAYQFVGHTESRQTEVQSRPEAHLRSPLNSIYSSTWGTCCGGYRPNAVALGRVTWMPRQYDPDNYISTYRREMTR